MIYEVERRSGLYGLVLYVPKDVGRRPGIPLLHGSEGGFAGWTNVQALALAHAGFVTLAWSYGKGGSAWHAGDIHDVDLDHTEAALEWLRSHEAVSGRVGLLGSSRGAEHALLLTSLMAKEGSPDIPEALAAHASSDTVVGAFIVSAVKPSASSHGGPKRGPFEGTPIAIDPKRAWRWRDSSDQLMPGTAIEIERYAGAIFLSHGEEDDVWSVDRTRRLEARLIASGRTAEVHYYGGEGHRLRPEADNLHQARLASFFRRHLVAS
jgi:dipeptidyl aminopeptidase/acylaminoacyl peptidase